MPKADAAERELVTIKRAAIALGVATSTVHRLLNDGIIAGEQITPGAPWRIRLTEDLKTRLNGEAGDGFLPMREAIRALGVSRQGREVKQGRARAAPPEAARLVKWTSPEEGSAFWSCATGAPSARSP